MSNARLAVTGGSFRGGCEAVLVDASPQCLRQHGLEFAKRNIFLKHEAGVKRVEVGKTSHLCSTAGGWCSRALHSIYLLKKQVI